MKEKSFEGTTRDEAEKRAADWLKSQRGIRITNRRSIIAVGEGAATKPLTTRQPRELVALGNSRIDLRQAVVVHD
jgi:hypothetical protein